MRNGENRFNRDSIDALHAALDKVAAVEGPVALVTTGADKFFSNGLDLDWLMVQTEGQGEFIADVHRLFFRIVHLDLYTVAAVNGHAFAGGAMLASAHDTMVMRSDRGYWCVPEVDLGLPLTEGMYATLAAHIPKTTLAEASLTGRRYTADEAVAGGIAAEARPGDEVVDRAVELAQAMAGKNREVIAVHKGLLHADVPRP